MQRKLPRSSARAYIFKLHKEQGGVCPICLKPIDITVMGRASQYVLDHCHETGLIRSVLHRGCNGSEGKVIGALGRWSGCGLKYENSIPQLRRLVEYLEYHRDNPSSLIYPDHKTDEEKVEAKRAKARKASALSRAKAKLKANKEINELN
jgi:hypothetical protein